MIRPKFGSRAQSLNFYISIITRYFGEKKHSHTLNSESHLDNKAVFSYASLSLNQEKCLQVIIQYQRLESIYLLQPERLCSYHRFLVSLDF